MDEENTIKISDENGVEKESTEITEDHITKKDLTLKTINFFKQKKVQWAIVGVLLLIILMSSSWIRFQNLPLLKDSTTGEYIPLALDPYYFLRVAETIIDNNGILPKFDVMRNSARNTPFHSEILPQVLVLMYKAANIFGNYSIQFIDVIYPVIFFILGLIVFFFLILALTNSKWTAILSCSFLAFVPSYLYRTIAGFSDHESIGMFVFFSTMLIYVLSLKYLEKGETSKIKVVLSALGTSALTILTLSSWGGVVKFIFMIIPLSFLLSWLINSKDLKNSKKIDNYLIFYLVWISSLFLFTLFSRTSILGVFGYLSNSSGLISLFTLGFIIFDYLLIYLLKKDIPIVKKYFKHRILFSVGLTGVFGLTFLTLIGRNLFSLIVDIWTRVFHPWGTGRVDLTVAENSQPFLLNWIAQVGPIIFWLFFAGMILIGFEILRGIRKRKNKIIFGLVWILMVSGTLFSRISANSILNGTNFLSQLVYLGSLILFIAYSLKIYFNDKLKIKPEIIFIASWMIFTILAGKAAVRMFFTITPFVCFMTGFFVIKIFKYHKESKDEFIKMALAVIFILALLLSIYSLYGAFNSIKNQAKYTGPSANLQWQKTMKWVRENTSEKSIFLHWWDYGYWVQTLGKRPTYSDGGHVEGAFGDHLVGRYVLTTSKPETAMSFMKTQNISYLLIDPTDIGKYPAYSKIGSDKTGTDRYSWITPMVLNPQQTQETRNGTTRIYQGGSMLDGDIIYNLNGKEILLPAQKAGIGGIILKSEKLDGRDTFKQPEAVFVYNGVQMKIPLRYIYYNKKLFDFRTGLNATIYIIPRVSQTNKGINIDPFGALIYLSPKNMQSLVVQVYLLEDSFERYKGLNLVHKEQDPMIDSLNTQGANLGDFIYFNGIRGPIKIWKVNPPKNILIRKEFLRWTGEYADMDNLEFTR